MISEPSAQSAADSWREAGDASAAPIITTTSSTTDSTGVGLGELHQPDQEHGHGNIGRPQTGSSSSSSSDSSSDSSSEISASGLLKFTDIPSYASQLSHQPTTPGSTDPSCNIASDPDNSAPNASNFPSSPLPANDSCTITTATSLPVAPPLPPPLPPLPPLPQPSSATTPLPISALRRTSPGLAARLKALGFGASKPSTQPSTPQIDRIGRLDEDQLRQLDEKHRAASIRSAISRRGRPWKGASATPSPKAAAAVDPDLTLPPIVGEDSPPNPTLLLPEIKAPQPLEMDTQKYRLPDHTNGNGTKVTLDTRREHLQRAISYPSPDEVPPPPPPKDTPKDTPTDAPTPNTPSATTPPNDYVSGLNSYFTPGHNRPGSIYTLSRASFANQLAQLTSLQLPDADTLSSQVSAIPTAQIAVKALINAADQIRSWIAKATEVIGGLDSEDDVEWAAAGGREGLAEVESAITRFEELIHAYVGAIEQLQSREDISNVSTDDLTRAVSQMEAIIEEWAKIRRTLQVVRGQVEIAMEWEELWNNVLGDIQSEMDELIRLVFEMEERRHKSLMAAASGEGVDIGDLETIVEDTPPPQLQAGSRFSLPVFPVSPSSPSPGTPGLSLDDSSLLALFARMQPLRASLDFLPMRLSVFEARASKSFPTACDELVMRREGLDANYKKLEKDAESLRKELGEDRWVIVFRGAGRQAQKMHESVERSLVKLQEAVEAGLHLTNQAAMAKKIESFEAKKTHYGPAIERVLSIIGKGVADRLTVNGEILRLHAEMQGRWEALKKQMKDVDTLIEEVHNDKGQQLRDSISSMLSNDRSTIGSGRETPTSSPPSSIILSSLGLDPHTPSSKKTAKMRSSSFNSSLAQHPNRRHSSLPAPAGHLGRKPGFSRLSTVAAGSGSRPETHPSQIKRPGSTLTHRPRWNGSSNTVDVDTGHNFKPLTLTTPSPYAKRTPAQRSASSITPGSGISKLPMRSPLARASSESPKVDNDTPTKTGYSRLSFRERLASPGPYSQQALAKPRLSAQSSMTQLSGRRSSLQTSKSAASATDEKRTSRPASSLASSSRRTSILPQPKGVAGSETGRSSPQAIAGARMAMRKNNSTIDPKDNKPRWRH